MRGEEPARGAVLTMKADFSSEVAPPPADPAALLAQARDYFRRGDLDEAKAILARLLDENQAVREVYVLLADIYRYEGETHKAEETLRLAAQAPPVLPAGGPVRTSRIGTRAIWVAPPPPVYWLVAGGGLATAVGAALAVAWVPPGLEWFGLSLLHLLLTAGAGFLAVGSLAASGLIRTFDQELAEPGPADDLPLWLWLLVAGLFSAWLGAFLLGWAAYVRGEDARTVGLVLGVLALLAVIIGVALGGGAVFWWLGLNVLWEAGLLGWALGSMAGPREWWQV